MRRGAQGPHLVRDTFRSAVRSAVRSPLLRALALTGICLLFGCETSPSAPSGAAKKSLDVLSLDALSAPVEGRIHGAPFSVADAFFRVVRVPDRERTDIVLAGEKADACGLPVRREGTRVVLRFPRVTALETGTLTFDGTPEPGAPFLLYEAEVDRRWVGVGNATARVAVDDVGHSTIAGRIDACFPDGRESCIRGRFRARRCASRLDGLFPREGNGLAFGGDEILTPVAPVADEPTDHAEPDTPSQAEPSR